MPDQEKTNTEEILRLTSELKHSMQTFKQVVREDKEAKDKAKDDPEALLDEIDNA